MGGGDDALGRFSAPTRDWFVGAFGTPTAAQAGAWPEIAAGRHTLLSAPTGSGKTLAAFLWSIDRLMSEPVAPADGGHPGTRVVYVSPLRALAVDVEKNLRSPLRGIALAAERAGLDVRIPTMGVRTGDTPPEDRRRLQRHPPDILVTTPESLYLMLTSRARSTLASVEVVIVDEIHAVVPTKRGAHLALTLERLEHWVDSQSARPAEDPRRARVQRIGLSATQRPLAEVALFLGGRAVAPGGAAAGEPDARPGTQADAPGPLVDRPVSVVDAGSTKELDLRVIVPVEDMAAPAAGEAPEGRSGGRGSIWPAIHPRLLDLIEDHRSTLVFVNARRLAERLAARLNELHAERRGGEAAEFSSAEGVGTGAPNPAEELVKAHHGSLSRERRLLIEDELKRGSLRGLVCTSSLELGIDMGAVDLVIQVESPGSVAAGLQRVGRAGHQVGAASRGRIFPKHRGDLLEAAVVVERMRAGLIERVHMVRSALDVAAQQIVAMAAMDDWEVAELAAVLRGAAGYRDLSDEQIENLLDLLAGRYPSEEFSELRPRIVWDRVEGVVRGRTGAQRLAVTNPGTIPDRGLFGVFLPDGTRVGELDEEMVYESRAGETFLLGATTWRIEEITFERVIVTPAPGRPGRMPFWHGDGPGRPLELGRAVGGFVRELRGTPEGAARSRLTDACGLDDLAATNLLAFLSEQGEVTGVVPDDRTLVLERFRDEIGDWRVCLLSPFGARVHAPWAMALRARLEERWPDEGGPEILWSDDGIVLRLPEAVEELPVEELTIDPDEIERLVIEHLPSSALFAARFRECAGRALLLPRRRPDRRTPLWQQRQRAADLLAVASKYPRFPLLLETVRECVNEVFDLPALREVLSDLQAGRTRLVAVDTVTPSPMAQSLVFDWISTYMYEGDSPLAERRAAALSLDRELLADLLGAEELRDLLDPEVVAAVAGERQRLLLGRRARDGDEVHDLLRTLGPLTPAEVGERCELGPAEVDVVLGDLEARRRAFLASVGSRGMWIAAEDAGRVRDALGVAVPVGLPAEFAAPVPTPTRDLVERFARTHGPFEAVEVQTRFALPAERVRHALVELMAAGRLVEGGFLPGGGGTEYVDVDVLTELRRRSLAALRREVEPTDSATLARFLASWQHLDHPRRGQAGLVEVIEQLEGVAVAASVLERDVLASRVADYRPSDLDALCAAGDLVWIGAGGVGAADGRVRLVFRDQLALHLPIAAPGSEPDREGHARVLVDHLAGQGASFWPDLVSAVRSAELAYDEATVLGVLWELVWEGAITNDTLAPVRRRVAGSARAGQRTGPATSRRSLAGRTRGRTGAGLRRGGPPAAEGRWSLIAPLVAAEGPAPPPSAVALARAERLLDRYGVVTREMALAEGVEGGFAGVYPVLKLLEERGQVRRGYFVAGLGAAQFARAGAADRLRSHREPGEDPVVHAVAATDPAQPYGAALPWPAVADGAGRPSRSVGAHVVLVDGSPAVYAERGGRSLITFSAGAADPVGGFGSGAAVWAAALAGLVRSGRVARFEIDRDDGAPLAEHRWAEELTGALSEAGFTAGYRGWVLRGDRR